MAEKKGGILKWVLLGCGVLGILGVVVCGGGGFLLFKGIRTMMLDSEAYQQAIEIAEPEIEERIGTPYEAGFLVAGSLNTSGGKTDADFNVPLTGPKGKGTLFVKATCYDGADCDFSNLTLVVGSERVDLLEEY